LITDYVIAGWLSVTALAVTPQERWAGARGFDKSVVDTRLFIWVLGAFLTALTISFLVITYKQRSKRAKLARNHLVKQRKSGQE
jgi:hypothetical protein